MAVDQEARDLINDILGEFATRMDGGTWGVPADRSVLVRQEQPPASGSSQFKVEDVPMAANTYLGRLGGDIVARTFANVLSDIGAAAASHTHVEADITDLGAYLTSVVAIADGGTGQTSKTPAFDALAPGTTKGDVIVHNGSDNIRLAVGTNGQLLTADSGEASGVKWATGGGGGDTHPIADSTAIVKGSADATKLVRVEADGLTTGMTRVLTMADQNIDLTPGTGAFATAAEGDLAATAMQNLIDDTAPVLGGHLGLGSLATLFRDSNSNEVVKWVGVASAVNFAKVTNAITGSGVLIEADGTDTNVDLLLVGKGTGLVKVDGVEVVTLSATQSLTAKTLTTPTIASFVNAGHNHQSAAGGATLDAAAIASGEFATARIADKAITYAKIQDVSATDKVLGRSTAGAGVVEEIACTAAGRALIDDASASAQRTTLGLGAIAVEASPLAISKGGTGQTTKTPAFDALAPLTTKGDVIVSNGSDAIRLAVGTNGQVLTADSAEASGTKWATAAGGGDVVGPGSAVDLEICIYDSTTGKLIKAGHGVTIAANGSVTMPNTAKLDINAGGDGTNVLALQVKAASDTVHLASTWRAGRGSGVGAAGLGLSHLIQIENAAGAFHNAGKFEWVWNDAADTSEDSRLDISIMKAGAFAKQLTIDENGVTLITPTIADYSNATHAHSAASSGGTIDHGATTGRTDDDHSIYALLAGRSGGQLFKGGTGSGDDATFQSTDHATRGDLKMVDNVEFAKTAVFDAEVDNGNSGTADTINWTLGNKQKSTLTGNVTYTFTAPAGPCNLVFRLVQDAGGTNTATWPATVKWAGGTAPVVSAGANDVSIIAFYFDGTNYHGTSSLDSS